ncbi:hypothetical protein H0E87_024452 [Populus deltoides]|uniref:UV-stimulated scaffold protein A homolog n=1 Tax=Populus deltoides TaxID=3696 RepID=A0A8T2X736_POPDE|nr:hypothetical protein H0E87_024452 [Populus deltoides]
MEMEEGGGKARALIEKATNSTAALVDPRLLKAIKTVVRYSDSELRLAAQTLLDLMKRDHSQVRYLTLLIIDELFMRSKLFRTLVVENLDQLLSLSVGFRRNHPLPAPPAVASILRSKAIEFLEKWNSSFGIHYRQIRLGFDYLKTTLRLQFPNVQANAARVQQERREREMKTKEILVKKFEVLKENLVPLKEEVRETVDEIGECLEIVKNKEANVVLGALDDDEDFEEFRPLELRQLRLDSLKEGEKVFENSENKVVFDALRELYKLLVTKHLVSVQEGISVLIRVEVADTRLRDSMLKEFIDIRNHLQSVKKKCVESGCALPDITKHEKEEEEDFWEEGKVESTDPGSFSEPNRRNKNSAAPSTSGEVKNYPSECSTKKLKHDEFVCSEGGGTDSSSLRSKLMTVAPVIEWGSFLDTWGSNRDVLANHRGLELESHWGRVDHDAVIPAKKIAELNLHATLYKEDRVEIQPCRAPLGKGGLCQRRDLRVCPFHGPIIPRDDEGNPINQGTSTSDLTLDLGTDLVEQLAEQAVKNVRDRDNEEARKRKMDKQSQKRAKLAKIREHNDAVLRDAAVASTSRSSVYGDNVEASSRDRLLARNKKDTLASMLRKKVTTKDRLSQRLLNTRASDAVTRQLTLDQASEDTYAGNGRIVSFILADKQFQFSVEAEEFCSARSVMLRIYSMLVGLPEQRKMSTSNMNSVVDLLPIGNPISVSAHCTRFRWQELGMELDSIECVPSIDLTDEDEIHHHHHLHHFPSVSKPHTTTTTTTTNNNNNNNTNTVASSFHSTSVHELLECPVCTNSMYPPIHQVFHCFGQYFCLHFEAFQLGMAPVYMAFLRFMGDETEARNYSYSLEVGGNGRKLIWEGMPRSIRDSHRKVRDSHDGLVIQRNMALFFSGGDRKELKLRVTGRIWKEQQNPEGGACIPNLCS